jgi:hypothetical protein
VALLLPGISILVGRSSGPKPIIVTIGPFGAGEKPEISPLQDDAFVKPTWFRVAEDASLGYPRLCVVVEFFFRGQRPEPPLLRRTSATVRLKDDNGRVMVEDRGVICWEASAPVDPNFRFGNLGYLGGDGTFLSLNFSPQFAKRLRQVEIAFEELAPATCDS